jgi:tRNA-splicing ligase RtcB (3'-phosphate/5'-hydroxy nucleic acid ligase)
MRPESSSTSEATTRSRQELARSLRAVGDCLFELPRSYRADMRVAARVFAAPDRIDDLVRDHAFEQLVNVTTLPGIYGPALGMPDMHEGYGFPVGGVAATCLPDGVISPGGIGFDINCGVRLLASNLTLDRIADRLEALIHELSRSVPAGYGRAGKLHLSDKELDGVLNEGVPYLIRELGLGALDDVSFIESSGALPGANAQHVSERARQRGRDQLGTLGGGNHFLEVQRVDEVFDRAAARAFGLDVNQIVVLIHTGSRGLGHQVCSDYVKTMDESAARLGIVLVDRQLAAAPLSSPEGQRYFAAMCAAANFGFANRQALTHKVREVFRRQIAASSTLRIVYDVAHNTAKIERYGERSLCVHRKGATRAFGPSSTEIPLPYRGIGQPVFIPGSMGSASYVLAGEDRARELSLASACHGAGRAMSRGAAKRTVTGSSVRKELEARGIVVRCPSNAELAEEAPLAYKDVHHVVDVVAHAGLARKVARLLPVGVLKG